MARLIRCFAIASILVAIAAASVVGYGYTRFVRPGPLAADLVLIVPKGLGVELREGSWKVPAIFPWLQKLGDVPDAEMKRVFNLGVGFVLICGPTFTNPILRTLKRAGEQAFVAGKVVKGSQEVTFVKG